MLVNWFEFHLGEQKNKWDISGVESGVLVVRAYLQEMPNHYMYYLNIYQITEVLSYRKLNIFVVFTGKMDTCVLKEM